MKKILLISVCLASCLALSASAFSDAGPPQTKKEIVVVELGVAQFHSFEINAVPEFSQVMFEQPVAVVLPNTSEKTKETKSVSIVEQLTEKKEKPWFNHQGFLF